MQELIKELNEKAGIDQGTAEKVADALKQSSADVPNLLSGDSQGMAQLLSKLGIDEATAQKVLAFLKENAGRLPDLLGGGGILKKAKDALGGILGKKEGQ
jgi:hypothetical protein